MTISHDPSWFDTDVVQRKIDERKQCATEEQIRALENMFDALGRWID